MNRFPPHRSHADLGYVVVFVAVVALVLTLALGLAASGNAGVRSDRPLHAPPGLAL